MVAELTPPTGAQHKAFGASLKAARENRLYTQQKLADVIGVARDTLRNWENGYRLPGAVWLRRLVTVLALRWEGAIVVNDPITRPALRLLVTPERPEPERHECAFDPRHVFVSVSPAPPYCGPACAGAAMRRERLWPVSRAANGSGR